MRKAAIQFVWVMVLVFLCSSVGWGQAVIYVDDDAGGAGDGSSWSDAFTSLQGALAAAGRGDEIRVGQGVYRPDTGSVVAPGFRGATFALRSGVSIYGGYAGVGSDYPDSRNPDLHQTVLSGDLNEDDNRELFEVGALAILGGIGKDFWTWSLTSPYDLDHNREVDFNDVLHLLDAYNYDDNCFHVVTVDPKVTGAFLDGFYICGGGTQGGIEVSGAGVLNYGGLTMKDCILSYNLSFYHPGMNATQRGGGGMVSIGGSPSLTGCEFSGNVCWGGGGGGMYNSSGDLDLMHCNFIDNWAMTVKGDGQIFSGGLGGGLYNTGENFSGVDDSFIDNKAVQKGGGVYNNADNFSLTTSYIYGNLARAGAGFYNWSMDLALDGCTVAGMAGYAGMNSLISLGGEGSLSVEDMLTLGGATEVTGGGVITVALGGELALEDMVTVNLDWGTEKGTIQCDGFLRVMGSAAIDQVKLNVSRSSFKQSSRITDSVITTQGELPAGQFYIQDNVTVVGNEIHAAGDDYLDLPLPGFYGLLENNRVYVTVPGGIGWSDGEVLEVRGRDGRLNNYYPDPNNPFLCRAPAGTIPDFFTDSWTLEELRIEDNAKVTLVNRFDYQYPYDAGGADEVLYVRNLILGKMAVLNTSFNRIYYENLAAAPTAKTPNRGILSLLLGSINFNNIQEFLSLVEHNNFLDSARPDYNRIHVKRVEGELPDPCGMMRLTALEDKDPVSSTFGQVFSARSKTRFDATSEDTIVIQFPYLFGSNDLEAELVIYLSDVPGLLPYDDEGRGDHYLEAGRLIPPPPGRPGAGGSARFGIFQLEISPGMMDLSQGFWIEFDYYGPPGSMMYMNTCSMMVLCDPMQLYCKDVSGDFGVTATDYLYIFGEYGTVASPLSDPMAPLGRACLDGSFNRDGYLDIHDLTEWDWFLSPPERLNQCDIPLAPGLGGGSAPGDGGDFGAVAAGEFYGTDDDLGAPGDPNESLLVASKWIHNISPYYIQDMYYLFDDEGQSLGSPPGFDHLGGRLVADKKGNVYQIHLENGLVGLWDPNVALIGTGAFSGVIDPRYGASATVYVGLQPDGDGWAGRPLLDAVLDREGFIYVLPVVVVPDEDPDATYLAAAQLEPAAGSSSYSLVKLFDDPPEAGDNQERNALREIEVDDQGNLYVVNSHEQNESDMLWVFDAETGAMEQKINFMTVGLNAPTALHLSEPNILYLTSSQNDPDAVTTSLVGLSTADLSVVRTVSITGMGHVTSITEDPVRGTIWAAGFKMENIPEYPDPLNPPFYYPFLAQVPVGSSGPIAALAMSGVSDMSAPMSMVWIGPYPDLCGGADINDDGSVNLGDLHIMFQYWLDDDCTGSADCTKANLDNTDGDDAVNLLDLAYFAQYWLWMDC